MILKQHLKKQDLKKQQHLKKQDLKKQQYLKKQHLIKHQHLNFILFLFYFYSIFILFLFYFYLSPSPFAGRGRPVGLASLGLLSPCFGLGFCPRQGEVDQSASLCSASSRLGSGSVYFFNRVFLVFFSSFF